MRVSSIYHPQMSATAGALSDPSQRFRTQSLSPLWVTGTQELEPSCDAFQGASLQKMTKLTLGAELGLEPTHSNMGCCHLTAAFYL